MNKNEYALVIYPMWKAEEICEMAIYSEDTNIKIKSYFEKLTELCSTIADCIRDVENGDRTENPLQCYEIIKGASEMISGIPFKLSSDGDFIQKDFYKVASITFNVSSLIKEGVERYYTFAVM